MSHQQNCRSATLQSDKESYICCKYGVLRVVPMCATMLMAAQLAASTQIIRVASNMGCTAAYALPVTTGILVHTACVTGSRVCMVGPVASMKVPGSAPVALRGQVTPAM